MEPAQKKPRSFHKLPSLIPQFRIDPQGTFKYIQIECREIGTGLIKTLIRGKGGKVQHHKDIFERFRKEVALSGMFIYSTVRKEEEVLYAFNVKSGENRFRFKCIGGGRMVHNPLNKSLEIYGFSTKYSPDNQTDHRPAITIASHYLPSYQKQNILISDKYY